MTSARRFLVAAFLLFTIKAGSSQTAATGSISGVVTDGKAPVGSVAVVLQGGRGGPATVTDDQGRFSFDSAQPGRYYLLAQRNGFASGMFGASLASGAPSPITVTAGVAVTNLRVSLRRLATISGSVRDTKGQPLSGAKVQFLQVVQHADNIEFQIVGQAKSDDTQRRRQESEA